MTMLLALLLALSLAHVGLWSYAIWWIRREWRAWRTSVQWLVDRDLEREWFVLRNDVAALLGSVQRQDQERDRERREVEDKIGSFLPGEAEVAKLEKAHREAPGRFISAQTPHSPSSKGSGISGGRSGPESSTSRAKSSRRG